MEIRESVVLTLLVLFSTYHQRARGGTGSLNIPACIITNSHSTQLTTCPTPLYKSCGFGVCCSAHHYCCNSRDYGNGYGGVSCCRRSGFLNTARSGEVASVVLGTIAWAAIVCVVGFLTCPRIYYATNRKLRISCKDKSSTKEIQMK